MKVLLLREWTGSSATLARGVVFTCLVIVAAVGAVAAPGDTIGSPQHTWAPDSLIAPDPKFGEGNATATIKQKWGTAPLSGQKVTICDSQWSSLNGATGYVDNTGFERILIWGDAGLTVPIVPTLAETAVPPSNQIGYLQGSNAGVLLEDHVSCPVTPACGDGIPQTGEQCDDGNTVDGDGCSSTCTIEGALATLQHLWASHHATATANNGGATLLTKFGCNGLGGCDQFDDVHVRICGTEWPSLNGTTAYLDDTPVGDTSEWWSLWDDAAFTVPVPDPAESLAPVAGFEAGRLSGPSAGVIIPAADPCPGTPALPAGEPIFVLVLAGLLATGLAVVTLAAARRRSRGVA